MGVDESTDLKSKPTTDPMFLVQTYKYSIKKEHYTIKTIDDGSS